MRTSLATLWPTAGARYKRSVAVWHWAVMLLLWLGIVPGRLATAVGQEKPAEHLQPATALEEARWLEAQISTLYGAGQYAAAIPPAQRVLYAAVRRGTK
jgi:hypothetical protein